MHTTAWMTDEDLKNFKTTVEYPVEITQEFFDVLKAWIKKQSLNRYGQILMMLDLRPDEDKIVEIV
jgi:hypothetical protein